MKTKIIYISGNEVFDIRDIRAAFEEVRTALNLDKQTILFGVPVDNDDAKIMDKTEGIQHNSEQIPETVITNETVVSEISAIEPEISEMPVISDNVADIPNETPAPKKRGRPRKENVIKAPETQDDTEQIQDIEPDTVEQSMEIAEDVEQIEPVEEKTIPVLSILSANQDEIKNESVDENEVCENIDIIPEISDEQPHSADSEIVSVSDAETQDSEPDLETLLSEMTPLQEDVMDEKFQQNTVSTENESDDISVDATLEQLATEFAETQDKISEPKTSARSKIGKLRNILPFKQSKHKDQGIGDLLEWAGIAANDEDFSVPGFFTNVASKK